MSRPTLTFAALWHIFWAALLVPYALVVALALGGQAAAQDLVDGLAMRFLDAVACATAGLVLNVGLAGLIDGLLGSTERWVQLVVSALVFAVIWFFAIQDLLPYLGLGTGGQINPAAFWAAGAGAAYGIVLGVGIETPPAMDDGQAEG